MLLLFALLLCIELGLVLELAYASQNQFSEALTEWHSLSSETQILRTAVRAPGIVNISTNKDQNAKPGTNVKHRLIQSKLEEIQTWLNQILDTRTFSYLSNTFYRLVATMSNWCKANDCFHGCENSRVVSSHTMRATWHRTIDMVPEAMRFFSRPLISPYQGSEQAPSSTSLGPRIRLWVSHNLIANPTPPVLVVKFAMLALAIHQSRKKDRYQKHFLLAGSGCTAMLALFLPQSPITSIQMYLPFCIVTVLLLSAVIHWLSRLIHGSKWQSLQPSLEKAAEGLNCEEALQKEEYRAARS